MTSSDADSEGEGNNNNVDPFARSKNDDESVMLIPGDWEEDLSNFKEPRAHEDVHAESNRLCAHLGLSKISTPALGDCLPQACMFS